MMDLSDAITPACMENPYYNDSGRRSQPKTRGFTTETERLRGVLLLLFQCLHQRFLFLREFFTAVVEFEIVRENRLHGGICFLQPVIDSRDPLAGLRGGQTEGCDHIDHHCAESADVGGRRWCCTRRRRVSEEFF